MFTLTTTPPIPTLNIKLGVNQGFVGLAEEMKDGGDRFENVRSQNGSGCLQ